MSVTLIYDLQDTFSVFLFNKSANCNHYRPKLFLLAFFSFLKFPERFIFTSWFLLFLLGFYFLIGLIVIDKSSLAEIMHYTLLTAFFQLALLLIFFVEVLTKVLTWLVVIIDFFFFIRLIVTA